MSKEIFLAKALNEVPKLLTLLDRNPHSPTYGCFDRNYWHYKIIDFPTGMSQEMVYPLALAWSLSADINPYYKNDAIRDWVYAGINFAAQFSHDDGSCDDYYPYEKASGAAAFSLLACVESYIIVGIDDDSLKQFFERRADWLANHVESGELSNHQALIILCLELTGGLLETDKWDKLKCKRLDLLLSWQNDEGWFREYAGFDPGYHTLTVSLLGWYYDLNPIEARVRIAITKGVDLALQFIHPDGTFGGEYGSRNTNNFFCFGFELIGRWYKKAPIINDLYEKALYHDQSPCYSDDHIIGHHIWSYLLTYQYHMAPRQAIVLEQAPKVILRKAGIAILRLNNFEMFIAINKGGVFKLFKGGDLIIADTGVSIVDKNRNIVSHLVDDYEYDIKGNEICIEGRMAYSKHQQMTSLKMIALRLFMLSLGRFSPNSVRKILQKLLITGKQNSKYSFCRKISFKNGNLEIIDKVDTTSSWSRVQSLGIGCDQTSIYVVMSRTFHKGNLIGFKDYTNLIRNLDNGKSVTIRRKVI